MTTKGFLWATEKNGAHTPRRGDYAREVTWDLPVVGFQSSDFRFQMRNRSLQRWLTLTRVAVASSRLSTVI